MPAQNMEGNPDRTRDAQVDRMVGDPVVLAAAAFALGLAAGLFLKGAARQMRQLARRAEWHRDHARTVTYHENLPGPLARRELEGQPRHGGTGALGVSPETVRTTI